MAWETTSESDTLGFNVLRSVAPGAEPELMTFLPSPAPGSTPGHSYGWQDHKVEEGHSYWYWVEEIDLSGTLTRHGPVSVTYAPARSMTWVRKQLLSRGKPFFPTPSQRSPRHASASGGCAAFSPRSLWQECRRACILSSNIETSEVAGPDESAC
ncbi:MAG: hypothetical protein V9H69_11140 [Anaerolineae bacterium]